MSEEAERRLLAAYIAGLRGEVGRQVRLRMPRTVREAIQLAVTTDNLEQREGNRARDSDAVARNVFTVDITCFACGKRGHVQRDCRVKRNGQSNHKRFEGNPSNGGRASGTTANFKKSHNNIEGQKNVECFVGHKRGHVMRDCRMRKSVGSGPNSGNFQASPVAPPVKRQN